MKCRRCGKDIEDNKFFCPDCEFELRTVSSKKEVNELKDLIEETEEKLEQTKELVELSELKEYETREERNKDVLENEKETEVIETREERNNENFLDEPKPNKKKKIIIIVSIITAVLILALLLILIFGGKKEEESNVEEVNYKQVLKNYGKSIEKTISEYMKDNKEVPDWKKIIELNTYKKHEVLCEIHNIYEDGSIYLNECKIDNNEVGFSYGEEKEEEKGKEINIYKVEYNNYSTYSNKEESGSTKVGTIMCKSEECSFISACKKYVLVSYDKKYYVYNYEKNNLEFGPFNMNSDSDYNSHMLIYNDTLYGIFYEEDNKANIYNVNTHKILKNVEGYPDYNVMGFHPEIMLKYNYVVLNDGGIYNFVNLKSGNISYSVKDNIGSFIEDEANKKVYMTIYKTDINKFKVMNSTGKLLFDGKEFNYIRLMNKGLIVADKKTFKIYDEKLNLKLSSKTYDEILGIYTDLIVTVYNNHLKAVDLDDKEIVAFDEEWSNDYYFHKELSGWKDVAGVKELHIYLENKTIPSGTIGNGLDYYYNSSTNEKGVTELEKV